MPETKGKPRKRTLYGKMVLMFRVMLGILLLDRWIFKPIRKAIERPAPLFQINWGQQKPRPEKDDDDGKRD